MNPNNDYHLYNTNELILKAQNGDQNAMSTLISINTPLVKSIAKRFNGCLEKEDVLQLGFIGLIKAVKGFDTSYCVKFSTYAVPLILGEIKRYIRDDGAVKIARSIKELRQRIISYNNDFSYKNGREASVSEICKGVGCDRDVVLEAIASGQALVSLEQSINGRDGNTDCLINHLESKREPEWIDIIQLRDCLTDLSDDEKQLISMRYYLNYTQTVIAEKLGMSQVQVSRLESKIIKKLRCKMK